MRLGPRQVRLITPFWPTLTGRTLRFTGRRNSIDLQETALVAEGDLLLFPCLGLERLFGRVLSARTTVTVPYSRLLAVRYRPRRVLRLVLLAGLAAVMFLNFQLPRMPAAEWTSLDAVGDALLAVPFVALGAVVWWGIRPAYAVRFRARGGRRTRLHFAVRSRAVRAQFDAALAEYRRAARAHAPAGGGD